MLFVFGWGRNTQSNQGPVLPMTCRHCNNNQMWNLWSQRTWFTLFFIPVIPYESRKMLACPVCQNAILLTDAQYDRAKQVQAVTQRYLKQEISQEEYNGQLRAHGLLT